MSFVLRCIAAALLLLNVAVAAESNLALDENAPLVIGVLPRRDATETAQLFSPLADYLSTRLGREVIIEPAKDFPAFWRAITERRYDIVHYNALHYIKSHKQFGYRVVAKNKENGESTIAGAVIVRKDSTIVDLQQLRGKKIAFGGNRDAMVSYVLPTLLLRRAGLKANDYTEVFVKNPGNAVTLTYIGETDASGASDMAVRPGAVTNVDSATLRILAQTEALPQLPWAISDRLDNALRDRLQHLLIGLQNEPSGRTVLSSAHLTALVPATDKEYDAYRRLLKELEYVAP